MKILCTRMQIPFAGALWFTALLFTTAPLCSAEDAEAKSAKQGNEKKAGRGGEPAFGLAEANELLSTYCVDCHNEFAAEADLNLAKYTQAGETQREVMAADRATWEKIISRVGTGEMPPEGTEAPSLDQRERFTEWAERTLRDAICGDGVSPGPAPLRRLNRTEYTNTMRDLLGIRYEAGHGLPADGAGGEGFDNAAGTLFISPIHAEKYLQAAKEALDYTAKQARARRMVFVVEPSDEVSADEAARRNLERFATRAFRRPAEPAEVDQLMGLYQAARDRDEGYEDAVLYALHAVLVSPKFLFLIEQPNETDQPRRISDYELASRLSYFLWASMPDKQLFQLARQGKLHQPEVLRKQVRRMLDDRKARGFFESFVGQWLGVRELGEKFQPDRKIFPRVDDELEAALRYEPMRMFEEILAENRSLLELIDADYTFLNRDLARLDGGETEVRQHLERVDVPSDSPRGGVVTMAGVLAVSSYPHRASPVLRGTWILGTLFGDPPPPPPPDVPELEENGGEGEQAKTLRERLSEHRANPVCASCHDRIDPLGFSLQNFDAIGRWRTEESGQPIDASGKLADGTTINGASGLKQVLMQRKDQFLSHLTEKMLGYALGRGLVAEDYCTVEQIVERIGQGEYKSHELILGIVESQPFLYRRPQPEGEPE